MRVIAGELGGRRLASPSGAARPTTDRVREAIFAMLGELSGARVLDLFCGSGALAIEAISRGAAEAVLVDTDPEGARRNLEELGIAARARLVRDDALRYLRREQAGERFDLAFCDPPYRLAGRLGPELDKLLPEHLTEGARVIVESSGEPGEGLVLSLPVLRERRYGGTLIRIHRAPGAGGEVARWATGE